MGTVAGAAYHAGMTVSAHDVAAVLRERLPGVGVKKLHKLLYYCQGHHLATFDEPLFSESISAWDMGPVVGKLWGEEKHGVAPPPRRDLGEAELNTVGYVLSRYGSLTGTDLEHLSHSEAPWQLADKDRRPGEGAVIELGWIREYFRTAGAAGEDDGEVLDTAEVRRWLSEVAREPTGPGRPDDMNELRARLRHSA